MNTHKMPVVFVGHGSPMNAIEDNVFSRKWKDLGVALPKPKAILAISAHWYTRGSRFQSDESPSLIYDFYGFPKELYDVKYPVKGDPALAERLKSLLGDKAQIDGSWGIDHGTWSVVRAMYPEADVPVVQLSIDRSLSLADYLEIGKMLRPLRADGVLILGSGNVVHSFEYVNFNMENGYPWAVAFDDYIKDSILEERYDQVVQYKKEGLEYQKVFQTLEHYAPLLYVLGAAETGETVEVFNRACVMGSMSMTSYLIGL